MPDPFIEKSYPQLVDSLYGAALHPQLWPTFLNELSAAFYDARGLLRLASDGQNQTSHPYGCEPSYLQSFADHYVAINPFTDDLVLRMPAQKVMYGTDIVPEETLLRSEFYNDWMKPQVASAHHCGVAFRKDNSGISVLTVAPADPKFDDNRDEYARRLALLVPHLSRAAEISRLSAAIDVAANAMTSVGGVVDSPAMIVAQGGTVKTMNAAAEAFVRAQSMLRVANTGQIHSRNPDEDSQLQAAIAASTRRAHPRACGPVRLTCRATGAAALAWVVPVPTPPAPIAGFGFTAPERCAYLFLREVAAARVIPADALRIAFAVTAAEARLLSALVAGHTLEDYAVLHGLSRNTVKNQLAALFDKTATQRQAELVSLVLISFGPMNA